MADDGRRQSRADGIAEATHDREHRRADTEAVARHGAHQEIVVRRLEYTHADAEQRPSKYDLRRAHPGLGSRQRPFCASASANKNAETPAAKETAPAKSKGSFFSRLPLKLSAGKSTQAATNPTRASDADR